MNYLMLTIGAFCLAISINCLSVTLQKQRRLYNRFKYPMYTHGLVITPVWLAFIVLVSQLNRYAVIFMPKTGPAGLLVIAISVLLFIAAISKVGSQALFNGNFFKPVPFVDSGIYKYLKDPIYDSYALLLIGLGLTFHNASFLIIALVSIIGLNIIESRIEAIKK